MQGCKVLKNHPSNKTSFRNSVEFEAWTVTELKLTKRGCSEVSTWFSFQFLPFKFLLHNFQSHIIEYYTVVAASLPLPEQRFTKSISINRLYQYQYFLIETLVSLSYSSILTKRESKSCLARDCNREIYYNVFHKEVKPFLFNILHFSWQTNPRPDSEPVPAVLLHGDATNVILG